MPMASQGDSGVYTYVSAIRTEENMIDFMTELGMVQSTVTAV